MPAPPLSLLPLGMLLGMRHALDPDHVVAVSAIVARSPSLRRAALVGAFWGLGHTATILLVGGAIILLNVSIAPRVGLAMEFAVAVMLVLLGVANLARRDDAASPPPDGHRRPLVVGMVHGLAGSAAVALLVVAAIPDPTWALAALLLFGLGTVVGMVGVTCLLGSAATAVLARARHARRWVAAGAGVLSVAFGVYLATQLVGDGLFGATPRWTPQ